MTGIRAFSAHLPFNPLLYYHYFYILLLFCCISALRLKFQAYTGVSYFLDYYVEDIYEDYCPLCPVSSLSAPFNPTSIYYVFTIHYRYH